MKCTDCKFCMEQDYGYSNWTIEGTEIDCLLDKNEKLPSDRFYRENPILEYANVCDGYTEGDPVLFDVDTTIEDYKEDKVIYKLLKDRK